MIVIDMDMPTKCMNCQLLGRDAMYCQIYPRKDLNLIKVANGKPNWCPIKCDIEDIRAEMQVTMDMYKGCEYIGDKARRDELWHVLEIIDKYIGSRNGE